MQINKPVYIILFSNAMIFSFITDSQVNAWLVRAFFSSFTFVLSPDKPNFEVSEVKAFQQKLLYFSLVCPFLHSS